MVFDGRKGVYFAVWAPKARAVSVIGEFNGWAEEQTDGKGRRYRCV